jgi:hypothetical protein
VAAADGGQQGCSTKNKDSQTKRRASKSYNLQPDFSYRAEYPGKSRINPPAGLAVWNFIGAADGLLHHGWNAGFVRSHPRRKNKNAARMGHPNLTPSVKMLIFDFAALCSK